MAEEVDENGELKYGEAHIMCNLYTIDAIEKRRREKLTRQKAMEMVDEYKDDLEKNIYEKAKEKINNANLEEALKEKPKRRIIRKNV